MAKLFVASVKMLARDKQSLFWAMVFPVMFAVVFGLFDFSDAPEVDVVVVEETGSPLAEGLVSGLRQVDSFTVVRAHSLASARAELSDGDADVVVSVPALPPTAAPSGGTAVVEVLYNEGNVDENQFALGAIERIVDSMNLRMAGVESPPLAVRSSGVAAKTVEYYDFLLPGLVAMGVMNFSIIGMAVAVARFREQRILKRILATPLSPVKFLSAQVLARLLLSVAQAGVILAVGVFMFGARIYGNVLWILVLATFANLIFLNIGVAVAGRAPNPDAAQGIGNVVALPMMFLAGVFFPTDSLPVVMQRVVAYLPLTPLIDALRKVAIDGLSIASTGPQLALLGGWLVVFFGLAMANFRFSRA